MKITVLGAGAWGTAAACLLCRNGHEVTLWGRNPLKMDEMCRSRRNEYLPGIDLPGNLVVSSHWDEAVAEAELIVAAIPSENFRASVGHLEDYKGTVVSLTKGIEYETGLTMTGILQSIAPKARVAALSGPTFAIEAARGVPTAIVVASHDTDTARFVQGAFHRLMFRVYTSQDVLGVELGGALKNVIAIAAGACDGLGFGDNSKAALITRAIAEIRRLGVAVGAQPETFSGLSGLGDLMVTCFSRLSRNRAFGEQLGRGEKLLEITRATHTVVEGFPTARSAYRLARTANVDTPIVDEVYSMLYEKKNLAQAVRDLIERDTKAED